MKEQNMAYDLKLTNRRKPVFLFFGQTEIKRKSCQSAAKISI